MTIFLFREKRLIFLRRAVAVILSLLASFMNIKFAVILAGTSFASPAVEWLSSGAVISTFRVDFGS